MPLHIGGVLPDGRRFTIDYRDPIALTARRWQASHRADYGAALMAWLDDPRNAAQSEMCYEGLSLRRAAGWCGHD
ncbi:MAG TPA: hypothetical protein VFF43_16355 [Caldimonas sp.]|nr:hypothetical protein [Caldimonas sp.]